MQVAQARKEHKKNAHTERFAFATRLVQAMEAAGFDETGPTTLTRAFNAVYDGSSISIHAARKWMVGAAIPTQEKLRTLAALFNVSPEWLRFGDVGDVPLSLNLSADEARALSAYRSMDDEARRMVADILVMMARKHPRQA